jgi:hypothetical protein
MAASALVVATAIAPSPLAAQASGEVRRAHMGVATCSGSTCHGRSIGDGTPVRQDEILRWQEESSPSGAHSRAYRVIREARGQAIIRRRGLNDDGVRRECLGCHATPGGPRGPQFQVSDGVGCEACHGAASGWIASHYAMGGTHLANVAAGMVPLDRPQVRARLCLDCQFGSAANGQFVSHRLMAAGHPRISFELDLFSALQQHWDIDGDYVARKGSPSSVRLWAVGQAEAVRRSVDLFARPDRGTWGIFPEFYFYDCHSCHRPITDGPERKLTFETNPARPIPFGMPPYHDENMIMLSTAARVLAPGQAAGFDAASRAFHAAMGQGREPAVAAARRLGASAAALSDALARGGAGSDDAMRVIAAIADKTTEPRFTDYAGSAQAVMAVDTLLNAMVREGRVTVGAAAGIRANINQAYAAVRSPQAYNPPQFRAALANAAHSIEALR